MNRFQDCVSAEEVVYQTVGAGSVCWQNPGGAGVFDDALARAVATDALAKLRELGLPVP
jgi:hypothetical protein